MIKIMSAACAIVIILAGLVILPMPIPFGAIMIVSGLILLISASDTVALYIQSYRRHHPKCDKVVRAVENRLPMSWQIILKRTDP